MSYRFDAEVWLWSANSAWHFVSLPAEAADQIDEKAGPRRGFGSVPVSVRIGDTRWQTSVFPDSSRGTFVLPVKKAVREAEGFGAGDVVQVELEVRA
jgi:hypothetical protein